MSRIDSGCPDALLVSIDKSVLQLRPKVRSDKGGRELWSTTGSVMRINGGSRGSSGPPGLCRRISSRDTNLQNKSAKW